VQNLPAWERRSEGLICENDCLLCRVFLLCRKGCPRKSALSARKLSLHRGIVKRAKNISSSPKQFRPVTSQNPTYCGEEVLGTCEMASISKVIMVDVC